MDEITKPKRKTRTSVAAVQRYKEKHYRFFRAEIKFDLADRIDAYLAARGITRAQFLTEAIDRAEKEEKNF